MALKPDTHAEPINNKDGLGVPCEWVEVHTYVESEFALIEVYGSSMDSHGNTVSLWLKEDDITPLRDALTNILT